jgi:hypothetical protein
MSLCCNSSWGGGFRRGPRVPLVSWDSGDGGLVEIHKEPAPATSTPRPGRLSISRAVSGGSQLPWPIWGPAGRASLLLGKRETKL